MLLTLLRILPRNQISWLFGWFARLHLPLFSRLVAYLFAKAYRIDLTDAVVPPNGYRNLQELFTRHLIPGSRPVEDAALVVSPTDGVLSQHGAFDGEDLGMIQAKGRGYTLQGLLRDTRLADHYRGGCWSVIYLAPHNYHRIHSPVDGEVVSAHYCPGSLWPVNRSSVENIDELFCANERLTSRIAVDGGGEILVVKVGATNVGRITLEYAPELVSNASVKAPGGRLDWILPSPVQLHRGALLGCFELGSTVVLVCDAVLRSRLGLSWPCVGTETAVRVGQAL